MTLLTPLALALSILALPIVAMYVLKLRRRELPVASTFLWRRAVDDVQANAPWQRLRPNVLLVLQLLVLLALILTLAQPAYSRSVRYTGNVIVIVDQSFGMQSRDVRPSRYAVALQQARTLAGTLGNGNVMSVIGMGVQPRLAIANSSDAGAITRALATLKVQDSSPNLYGALSLASALSRNGAPTRAVLLTSRASGITTLPLPVPFPVEIVRIGGRERDLGIASFDAARYGAHVHAIASIENFGAATARSVINLWVDGQIADARPVTLPPGRQQTFFWGALPSTSSELRITLSTRDNMLADKSAWVVISAPQVRHVLLVSTGDYFLQTALALDTSIRLDTVAPDGYRPSMTRAYGMVIFDGALPRSLPITPTLIVDPPAGGVGSLHFGADKATGTVALAPAGQSGPLASVMHYVDLSAVHVVQVRRMSGPTWLQPVASSGIPLVEVGNSGVSRYAVVAFDLQDSDWPLRISFPIMVRNLVRFLVPGLLVNSGTVSAGQPVQLYPAGSTNTLAIHRPDGSVDILRAPFPAFTDTSEPGIYTVRSTAPPVSAARFVVNFIPGRPASAAGPAIVWRGQSRSGVTHHSQIPISVAWIFGIAALFLLTTEWWLSVRA